MGPAPLVFVVPDAVLDLESGSTSHAMSIALRLSHDLLLYHRLDSEIMINSEVNIALLKPEFASAFSKGNVIVVGNEAALELQTALHRGKTNFVSENNFIDVKEFMTRVHIDGFNPNGPELQPGQGM